MFYLGFKHFLLRSTKYWARKICSRYPKCRTCHTKSSSCPKIKMTTVSQNETFVPFKPSSKFTKYCASRQEWPWKPPLLSTRGPEALATRKTCHTQHTDCCCCCCCSRPCQWPLPSTTRRIRGVDRHIVAATQGASVARRNLSDTRTGASRTLVTTQEGVSRTLVSLQGRTWAALVISMTESGFGHGSNVLKSRMRRLELGTYRPTQQKAVAAWGGRAEPSFMFAGQSHH